MVFELVTGVATFSPGDTATDEELRAAGCDVDWLVKAGAVRPVGFIASGPPLSDADAGRIMGELNDRVLRLEDERDALAADKKELVRKVAALETGHAVGAGQLNEALATIGQLRAQLAGATAPA